MTTFPTTTDNRIGETLKAITTVCGCYGYSEPKNGAILARIAHFVVKNFSSISPGEIMTAFEDACTGKLGNVELNPVGQQINNAVIGKVLTAYRDKKNEYRRFNPEIKKIEIPQLDSGELRRNLQERCERIFSRKNENDYRKVWTIDYEFINENLHEFTVEEKINSIQQVKNHVIEELKDMRIRDGLTRLQYENRIQNIEKDYKTLNYAKKWLAWTWCQSNVMSAQEMIDSIEK